MNKRQFVQQREPVWQHFQRLVRKLGRISVRKIPSRDVNEYSRLFREISNDLATVRSRGWGTELENYLNHLVSRGHGTFYTAPPGQLREVLGFLTSGFPRLLRANIWYFVTACVLFFGSGAMSWIVIQNEPELANRIIPESQLSGAKQMYAKRKPGEESGQNGGFGEQRTLMAGFYIYNNVGIALSCFARGVLLGVGTVYTLLFNGIYIGAVAGYVVTQADAERFLSFVIGHGSFELTAIAVAGMGGLMMGATLLHPGPRTRLQALRERGIDAVKIGIGAAVMLVIAALIEGFWSPANIPAVVKYIVGTLLWGVVILYLAVAGRGQ
ncbi:MAG: stage II sporulation protein M [Planctomycetaceae bacterium]